MAEIVSISSGLTDKQLAFCREYIKDSNGTQSAIRAGYSAKTANEQASRLLAKVNIQTKIQSLQSKVAVRAEVSRERVLAQYAKLAFFDPRKFYDSNGQFKNVVDLDDDSAAAITGLEIEESTIYDGDDIIGDNPREIKNKVKKIKFTDMKGALDSICKMEGYNTPDAIITHGKVETVVTFKRG